MSGLEDFLGGFADTAEGWGEPEPLPPAHEPPAPFDIEMLPAAFAPYCTEAAELMSCPLDFLGAAVMTAAGAAIGRGLAIRPKARDGWTVVPNLWGCVIAPPSAGKSPALKAAFRGLEVVESKYREAYATERERYSKEAEGFEIKLKAAKRKAEQRAAKGEPFELPEPPEAPVEKRTLVNTATPEKLVAIHAANPRGLLVLRDELTAWLRGFDKAGRESERAFYLEAWDGLNAFRADTLGRGSDYLPAACVSVFGSMQPGTFRAYLESAGEASKADGLLQRFGLLVWPERVPFVLRDGKPSFEAWQRVKQTFERLASLNEGSPAVGCVDEPGGLPFLRFEDAAQAAFLGWLEGFMQRLATVTPEAFEGHLSKYRKLLPALALICELVDNPNPRTVSLESWQRAERWGAYLETHLRKVYAPAIRPEVDAAERILAKLKTGELPGIFSTRLLYEKGWEGLATAETCRAGLELLENLNWVRREKVETGGRPSEQWQAHPFTVPP